MTIDVLSELISAGTPLTAYQLMARLRCSLEEVMADIKRLGCEETKVMGNWWHIATCGGISGQGFLYFPRPVISTTKRMAREVKEYINVGISPSGPKGHIL